MQLISPDLAHMARIAEKHAFCAADPRTHVHLGGNRNPALRWSGAPAGTRSFVLLCVDPDVPTKADDVNQEGRSVPVSLPRTNFYHWAMVDIAPTVSEIAQGACSDGVTPRGKRNPPGPPGSRQGVNDYTGWFANDKDMSGEYFGYDGPCPPWNDALLHHYHFVLLATDLARCPLDGAFPASQVEAAIKGHVLAEARLVGTYSLNRQVR